MKRIGLLLILPSVILAAWLSGCTHEKTGPGGYGSNPPPAPPTSTTCNPDTVYFENAVLPIYQSNCAKAGCHDVASGAEGVVLDNYYNIYTTGGCVPGNPNKSRIYTVLNKGGEDRMPTPPYTPISSSQMSTIEKWINQGALNSRCDSVGCDTVNVTYASVIQPLLALYCTGCHSGPNPSYSINLTTYQGIVAVANSGRLMGALRWENGFFPMPKNGNQLSTCHITQFQVWINTGMPQ
jgi:hypothetical protein